MTMESAQLYGIISFVKRVILLCGGVYLAVFGRIMPDKGTVL